MRQPSPKPLTYFRIIFRAGSGRWFFAVLSGHLPSSPGAPIAERSHDGSRGLKPAVGQWEKPSRRATLESLAQSGLGLNRRSTTKKLDGSEPWAEAHGYHHVLAPRGGATEVGREAGNRMESKHQNPNSKHQKSSKDQTSKKPGALREGARPIPLGSGNGPVGSVWSFKFGGSLVLGAWVWSL